MEDGELGDPGESAHALAVEACSTRFGTAIIPCLKTEANIARGNGFSTVPAT